MNLSHFTNLELLGCVIGVEEAERVYKGSLTPLFAHEHCSTEPLQKLTVAHELVMRYLFEELRREHALSSPRQVENYLRALFAGKEHESFVGVFLDSQHRVIAAEELSRGTIDGASVYPREVVKRTLQLNAAAVIFAHNHPSGIAEPSMADRQLTEKLKSALAMVDVRVLDHIVMGGSTATSFAEKGWL